MSDVADDKEELNKEVLTDDRGGGVSPQRSVVGIFFCLGNLMVS